MLHETTKQVTVEQTRVNAIECDVCHAQFRNPYYHLGEVQWDNPHCGEYEKTTVSIVEAFQAPGDCWQKRQEWHVCPDCFRQIIVPALTAASASLTY